MLVNVGGFGSFIFDWVVLTKLWFLTLLRYVNVYRGFRPDGELLFFQ